MELEHCSPHLFCAAICVPLDIGVPLIYVIGLQDSLCIHVDKEYPYCLVLVLLGYGVKDGKNNVVFSRYPSAGCGAAGVLNYRQVSRLAHIQEAPHCLFGIPWTVDLNGAG